MSAAPSDIDPKAVQRQLIAMRQEMAKQMQVMGTPPWTIVANVAYQNCEQPAISVVISLFNYASYIQECLESVCTSDTAGLPAPFEIIIVDDGSTDQSVQKVEEYLALSNSPICLVKKTFNTGTPETRNLGIQLSRAEYVFVLDADNWIYPNCLSVLYKEIVASGCAAVYNIITQFDSKTGEGVGLVSQFGWNPRELVRRPYIDCMALYKKQALLDLGGYSPELFHHGWFGWEDYDMWLKLAQADQPVKLVPQILSAYRVHGTSQLRMFMRYFQSIANYFDQKFAPLVDRYPDLDMRFWLHCMYEGFLDTFSDNTVSGWVWDKAHTNRALTVDIYLDSVLHTTIPANLFRYDLAEAGKGSGFYGFTYRLPQNVIDGESHVIQVFVTGTTFQLVYSPQRVALELALH